MKLIREREILGIRRDDGSFIKEFSLMQGFPTIYVSDLIGFMNSREELIKEFVVFVLEERKKDLEERKREVDGLKKLVEAWVNE